LPHQCAKRSRRSIRFARLARERITTLHAGKLIATFDRACPARRSALADQRRIVVGDGAGEGYLLFGQAAINKRVYVAATRRTIHVAP
jgi:hypothetical protein